MFGTFDLKKLFAARDRTWSLQQFGKGRRRAGPGLTSPWYKTSWRSKRRLKKWRQGWIEQTHKRASAPSPFRNCRKKFGVFGSLHFTESVFKDNDKEKHACIWSFASPWIDCNLCHLCHSPKWRGCTNLKKWKGSKAVGFHISLLGRWAVKTNLLFNLESGFRSNLKIFKSFGPVCGAKILSIIWFD